MHFLRDFQSTFHSILARVLCASDAGKNLRETAPLWRASTHFQAKPGRAGGAREPPEED